MVVLLVMSSISQDALPYRLTALAVSSSNMRVSPVLPTAPVVQGVSIGILTPNAGTYIIGPIHGICGSQGLNLRQTEDTSPTRLLGNQGLDEQKVLCCLSSKV